MTFEVNIEVFEGPFGLLLHLIMRQELDIHTVPVAQITASYLEHLDAARELDLDTATEFLVIAATLLLIKARSLLGGEEEEDVAGEAGSPGEDLAGRLIEYSKFQKAAEWLAEAYAENGGYLSSFKELDVEYATLYPDPFEGVSIGRLAETLAEMMVDMVSERVDTSFIAPVRVSVPEQIERVRGALRAAESVTFGRLASTCVSRIEVIAVFLAILELCKNGEVLLSQKKRFGEIDIVRREVESSGVA